MSSQADPLDSLVTFGKYKGTGATWRQVAERDPDYARWLRDDAEATPDDVREALADEDLGSDGGWGFSR